MTPHEGQPVATAGPPLGAGQGAIILIHGRNAGPANILDLAAGLGRPAFSCLAPAAADRAWYPNSFMADIPTNEPGLSSGLGVIEGLVANAAAAGVPPSRVVLMGFSQGACLTAEFAVRHPARYGAVVVFSGGLIGPHGTTWPDRGSLSGTPVFLGCSDIDSHVPASRVRESEAVFARLGADVTARIYPGMGHLVNDDEMQFARQLLDQVGT